MLAIVAIALAVVSSASAQIVLEPVASGLASPVFATHANDRSGRLFVVEQPGVVRVLRAAFASSSVFLDVRDKVVSGGERGLLGLAFHPGYASNGRFFVFYTRAPDGALVIAEFGVSADPDVADTSESVLLVIPHPLNSNHNGGMLAFGPNGYLYAGVGDGGGGNDPTNQAQDVESLLGKILRIDVDRADAANGTRYASPPDNPFVGRTGRDEIFALGLRNPWRFSFDRATGAQWVGDVGQNAREEVNAPIVNGGNYGWRVFEGTRCTGNDPSLCGGSYIGPLFEYVNGAGRCSITGGHVYRGALGTLPQGTYVYGDYCSGEILGWDGASQRLLLDSPASIASFGEDQQGELYVVDLGGTLYRIRSTVPVAVEYVHAAFGHYFVTSRADEIAKLDIGAFAGWSRTGESFGVFAPDTAGATNVCRFFSASFAPRSSHFYSPVATECENVRRDPDWQFEGETFAIRLPDTPGGCPVSMQPLYRLFNEGASGAPNHRYTTRLSTREAMLAQGWTSEGFGPLGVIGCLPSR
jgi:glucose/arabinose dehydrogenase